MQTIKTVKPFGKTSSHICLPKQWIGKRVLISEEGEDNPILRKKEIVELIEKITSQLIQDASKSY